MNQVRFSFNSLIEKAEERDGKHYIVAVASDTTEDQHGERVTATAIERMCGQLESEKIPLLESHKSTFELGYASRGMTEKSLDKYNFVVEFELDMDYVECQKLYKSVCDGKANKQLSIGGFLDVDEKDCVIYENREDGSLRRALNKIRLDHIALTRRNQAANGNTGFRYAMLKALDTADAIINSRLDSSVGLESLVDLTDKFFINVREGKFSDLPKARLSDIAKQYISNYTELGITPPLGLNDIVKSKFSEWTKEDGAAWENEKSALLNIKEKEMAKEDAPKTDDSVLDVAKAANDFALIAKSELTDEQKASVKNTLGELCGLYGVGLKATDASSEDASDTRKLFTEGLEQTIAATKGLDAKIDSVNTELKTTVETLKSTIHDSVKELAVKLSEDIIKSLKDQISALETRISNIEKLETGSTSTEKSEDVDDSDPNAVFKGMFDAPRKFASQVMK